MAIGSDNQLLSEIIPFFNAKDFESRFEKNTVQLSKSRRFLLKMELNRLFTPCQRVIDLRGRVDSPCTEFNHQDRTHYLDSIALNKFEESMSVFNGYTIGVFEDVTNTQNSYRAKQQLEDQHRRNNLQQQHGRVLTPQPEFDTVVQDTPHQAEVISLTQFHQRSEERNNIITKISVRLRNGRHLQGITSNLSVSGSKIKIPAKYDVNVGDIVYVDFLAIAADNSSKQPKIKEIAYTVLEITTKNDFVWLSTMRQHKDAGVNQFLFNFIKTQRKNSVIDISHIIEAVRSLGYQQQLINKISGLPLFFSNEKHYKLEMALCNFSNRQALYYWQNQSNLQKIAGIFSQQRLTSLLAKDQDICTTTLYCFTHVTKGKKFFYSATIDELERLGLKEFYCSFGAKKDSWQVYQLQLCPTDTYSWQLPEVLPSYLIKQQDISVEQHQHLLKLHQIKLMAYLIPISSAQAKQVYQDQVSLESNLGKLQQFCHQDKVHEGLRLIDTNQLAQRFEDRYSYQTKVHVHHNKQIFDAKTIDFSSQGMQIKLQRSIDCENNDVINIQMPLLQRSTGDEQASIISYQIVRITPDGKILNLKVISSTQHIDGPRNIYRLIKQNKNKLTAQVAPPPMLIKSLNLLFSQHIPCLPLIISRESGHLKLTKVIQPSSSNRLFNLFSALSPEQHQCNVGPITKNKLFFELFEQPIKQLSINPGTIDCEIYIQLFAEPNSPKYHFTTQLASKFTKKQQHIDFIEQKSGQFYAIKMLLTLTDKVDYKHVSREIIYAAKQASFKTRQLQAQLDSSVAIAELIDITDEVKSRYFSA